MNSSMDFQTIYQLYDYYTRMFCYHDCKWMFADDNEDFYLANEYYWLRDCMERALQAF